MYTDSHFMIGRRLSLYTKVYSFTLSLKYWFSYLLVLKRRERLINKTKKNIKTLYKIRQE